MDSDTDCDIYSDIDEGSTVELPQTAETETCQFSRSGLEGWVMDEPLQRKLSVKHQMKVKCDHRSKFSNLSNLKEEA